MVSKVANAMMISMLLLCLQVGIIQGFVCPPKLCDKNLCVSQTCPENHILSETFCGCCMQCVPVICKYLVLNFHGVRFFTIFFFVIAAEGELCFAQFLGIPNGAVCADGLTCCNNTCSNPANCPSPLRFS